MRKRDPIVHSDYAEILLPHNYNTKIDLNDIDLAEYNWRIDHDFVVRSVKEGEKIRKYFIHRIIIERKLQKELQSDIRVYHVNGDKLDNRRENLITISEYKECRICHETKSISEFYSNVRKDTGWRSTESICKMCKNKYAANWAKENRDSINARRKAWRYRTGENRPPDQNHECSLWLGNIAESILMEAFGAIERMPPGNRGYDFICKNGYKIDAKSSCLLKKAKVWQFDINKNDIADYFICLGFDNRKSLIPTKVWLIKGELVRGRMCIAMGKHKSKWDVYLRDINKIQNICNIKKNGCDVSNDE